MDYHDMRRRVRPVPTVRGALAHLSPSDLAGTLAEMLISTDQETIWSQACMFFGELGFPHVLYGYSPDSRGAELGAPENYLILSTFARPVIRELLREGYFRQSATFNWALKNAGLASWSMTPEDAGMGDDFLLTPEGAAFFARHGMMTGCSVGFSMERTRGRAVMALIAPPTMPQDEVDHLIEDARDVIFAVAATAHRCLSNLPYHPPGRRLTQRQREVLEWVAEGKTSADIALIMGITPPTVEKHLRLARETLGVETTAHALIKASFLNQVFVATPADYGTAQPFLDWQV